MGKHPSQRGRRRFLVTSGTVLCGGLAGCVEDQGNSSQGTVTTKSPGRESSATATPTTHSRTIETEDVTIESAAGSTIDGTLYGEGSCGVVLVPQINLDRGSWEEEAIHLANQGNLVLAIDEDPNDRSASVSSAVRLLRQQRQVDRVILIGASSGGEAVLVANAEAPSGTIDGTITLSAAGGEQRADQLQGELLFVVSKGDADRFVSVARSLQEDAPEPKTLLQYSGDAHGQRLFDSPHADGLRKQIVQLIASACSE